MSDYLPQFADCPSFTLTLTATVTGGQWVTWAGAVAGDASTNVAGVAAQDGVSGDKITVWGPGHHKTASTGAIAQGAAVCTAAAGVLRAAVVGTDPVNSIIARAKSAAASNVVAVSAFGI